MNFAGWFGDQYPYGCIVVMFSVITSLIGVYIGGLDPNQKHLVLNIWPNEIVKRPGDLTNNANIVILDGDQAGWSCLFGRCEGFAKSIHNKNWFNNIPGKLNDKGISSI